MHKTFMKKKNVNTRLPWWSSGYNSTLPLQGMQIRSLVGKLRFCTPRDAAKKKQTKEKRLMLFKDFKEDLNRGVYNVCG